MKRFDLWVKIAAYLGHYWVRFATPLRTAYTHGGWEAVKSAYLAILALEAERGESDWIGISPPTSQEHIHVTGSGRLHISVSDAGVHIDIHRPAGKAAEVRFDEGGLEWRNSFSDYGNLAVGVRHIQAVVGLFDAICEDSEGRKNFRCMIESLLDCPSLVLWAEGWPYSPHDALLRDDLEFFTRYGEAVDRARLAAMAMEHDAFYISKNLEPTFVAYTAGELVGFGRVLPTGAYHIDGAAEEPQTRGGETLYAPAWVGNQPVDYHPFAYAIVNVHGSIVRSLTRAQYLAVSGENGGVNFERMCAGLPYACYRLRAHSWNPVTGEWQEVDGIDYPSTRAGEIAEVGARADLAGRL